jgi:signal peptidase II
MLSDPATDARIARVLARSDVQARHDEAFSRWVLGRAYLSRDVAPGVNFTLSTNPGVVFGFDWLPRWLVNAVTIAMVFVVVIFFATSPRGCTWLHVALALILGGAIGNLYDRLFSSVALPGLAPIRYHVRDFIDCSELHYNYIFNVADAWLVIGVAMILLHWVWTGRKNTQAQAAE